MNDLRGHEVRTSRVHSGRRHLPRSALPWAALALLAIASGCPRTALDVVVEGDLSVPDQVDSLSLRVSRGDVEVEQRYPLGGPARPLEETITLLPGAKLHGEVRVRAVAWRGQAEVGAAEETGRFRDGETAELRLRLVVEGDPPGGDAGTPDGGPPPDSGPDSGPDGDCVDEDGDGFGEGPGCLGSDCDEDDEGVHPGADEDCNEADDDCDLLVDEGCACNAGQSQLCGSIVGECSYGAQVCRNGTWDDDCTGGNLPEEERCDGDDNDCDGLTDEGC